MNKLVNKTIDALSRIGESVERRLSTDESQDEYWGPQGPRNLYPSEKSAFRRPLDKKGSKYNMNSSKDRDLIYGGARRYSSDHLVASPGYGDYRDHLQTPMSTPYSDRSYPPAYGTPIAPYSNYGFNAQYGSGAYPGLVPGSPYGPYPANVGYAPDYYVAERREVELVPAPPPRIIHQPVPVPVDRPVPQPYPVEVIRPVPVDRPVPVPVPVPSPVPVDRPVPIPVPVPVPSPPVCIPVPIPVPSPVPCYIPVGVPVPSPPPSPVIFEQSVTHTQRWINGSSVMMNQQPYYYSAPMMNMFPHPNYANMSFIR